MGWEGRWRVGYGGNCSLRFRGRDSDRWTSDWCDDREFDRVSLTGEDVNGEKEIPEFT